jgi:hypothetical protein
VARKLTGICPTIGLYPAPFVYLKLGIRGNDITGQNRAGRLSTTILVYGQDLYHMNYNNQIAETVSFRKMGTAKFHATSGQE